MKAVKKVIYPYFTLIFLSHIQYLITYIYSYRGIFFLKISFKDTFETHKMLEKKLYIYTYFFMFGLTIENIKENQL